VIRQPEHTETLLGQRTFRSSQGEDRGNEHTGGIVRISGFRKKEGSAPNCPKRAIFDRVQSPDSTKKGPGDRDTGNESRSNVSERVPSSAATGSLSLQKRRKGRTSTRAEPHWFFKLLSLRGISLLG